MTWSQFKKKKHMKQKLTELKGETESSTIIVGDFNIPLTITEKTTRQKISQETEDSNNTIKQFDLIYMYKILHPTIEYILLSSDIKHLSR